MLVSPTGFNMFQHFCGCLLQSRKVDLLLANSCGCIVGLSYDCQIESGNTSHINGLLTWHMHVSSRIC